MPYISFSLDFDGCSCILFDATKDKVLKQVSSPAHIAYYPVVINLIEAAKEVFSETLNALIEGYRKTPEVFCGSNRQSRLLDNKIRTGLGSPDSALDMLSTYCTERGFLFNKFLLIDKYRVQADGSPVADGDSFLLENEKTYDGELDICKKSNEWDPDKIEILCEQVKRAGAAKPDDILDFYFLDDDLKNKIIPGLKAYFLANPSALPSNVRLHLIKYNWQELYNPKYLQLGTSKDTFKTLAKSLVQPQGVIEHCELAEEAPKTKEAIFEISPPREASLPVIEVIAPIPAEATDKKEPADDKEESKADIAAPEGSEEERTTESESSLASSCYALFKNEYKVPGSRKKIRMSLPTQNHLMKKNLG